MNRRHSPAVYRRRRLVFFGGLLIVVAGIVFGVWLLFSQLGSASTTPPGGNGASAEPGGQAGTGEGSDPELAPTPEPVGPCVAANIVVVPIVDATEYAAGVNPQLGIELKNTGEVDCIIDVGTATQKITVTSGRDVWWRSVDCQQDAEELEVTLEAGRTVTSSAPVVWDRTRSSKNTCASDARPAAPGGGASYHVSVEIGGFASSATKQIFLY